MMARTPLASMQFPGLPDTYTIPQKTSDLTNDSGFLTAPVAESDLSEELQEKVNASNEGVLAVYPHDTVTGSIASFPDGADDIPVKDLSVAIEPQQSGSGDPSPDNVRPISGWTGANVTKIGANFADLSEFATQYPDYCTMSGDTLNVSLIAYAMYTTGVALNVPCNQAGGGYLSYDVKLGTASGVRLRVVYEDGAVADAVAASGTDWESRGLTLSAKRVVAIRVNYSNQGTVSFRNLSITLGTTAVPYEPYNGTTIPITFPSAAGTVYGGTLDVTTGKLTVDMAMETFSSSTGFSKITSYTSADRYVKTLSETAKVVGADAKFVAANFFDVNAVSSSVINAAVISNNRIDLRLPLSMGIDTVAKLGTYLATTPLQVVYELANSTVYDLTPIEVKTLLAQNNIWADCGDTTVNYRADTTLFINKKIAALAAAMN